MAGYPDSDWRNDRLNKLKLQFETLSLELESLNREIQKIQLEMKTIEFLEILEKER